jgi:hypothetical protein
MEDFGKVKGRLCEGNRSQIVRSEKSQLGGKTQEEETKLWLKFALDCGYNSPDDFKTQSDKWDEVGKMLHGLHDNWRTYR